MKNALYGCALGYPNTAENQCGDGRPDRSDKSDITIQDAPIPDRRSGPRFSTKRLCRLPFAYRVRGNTLLRSTGGSVIWRASVPLLHSKTATTTVTSVGVTPKIDGIRELSENAAGLLWLNVRGLSAGGSTQKQPILSRVVEPLVPWLG